MKNSTGAPKDIRQPAVCICQYSRIKKCRCLGNRPEWNNQEKKKNETVNVIPFAAAVLWDGLHVGQLDLDHAMWLRIAYLYLLSARARGLCCHALPNGGTYHRFGQILWNIHVQVWPWCPLLTGAAVWGREAQLAWSPSCRTIKHTWWHTYSRRPPVWAVLLLGPLTDKVPSS